MAAAWNRNTADDGASNLWLCSSGGLRVTLLVLRLRAGRYQRKCKHDGRNNGYDCFHASALHELWRIVRWRSGLVEHDVDLRRSNRVGPRANRRNAAPECPLWVKSGHVQCTRRCLLCANSGHSTRLFDHLENYATIKFGRNSSTSSILVGPWATTLSLVSNSLSQPIQRQI